MNTDDFIDLGPELAPEHYAAVRERGGATEPIVVRKVREGESLTDDALVLEKTDHPNRFAVTEVRALRAGHGPAQVASPQYRENFDRIFGGKQEVGQA